MVKVVKTPSFSRQIFTANELSGHPDNIQYTPKELKQRRKYRAQNNLKLPVDEPTKPVTFGRKVS